MTDETIENWSGQCRPLVKEQLRWPKLQRIRKEVHNFGAMPTPNFAAEKNVAVTEQQVDRN